MNKKSKIIIWASATLAVLVILFATSIGISNGQIKRQQEVQTAKANISKEEERIVRILNKMQPDYKEQQRQNMKKFVRSL